MAREALQLVSIERWPELQEAFLSDWPRGLPGYNVLETQTRLKEAGFDYGIEVYCPFGDADNGFVAVNEKASSYELIIQYPKDDTSVLEEALRTTKVIDWERNITLAFAAYHVVACLQKVIEVKNTGLRLLPSYTFMLKKDSPFFEDVSLPPGFSLLTHISFELLTPEYIDLIDSKWPHRYPTSTWFFKMLIDTKSGYGLYKNGELISWIFTGECGHLTHLYTLEDYRNQGFAALTLKLISNELLKKKIQVYAFCVKGNEKAYKLYKKIGFAESVEVTWGFLSKKSS